MSVKTVKAVINGTTHTLTYSSSSGKYEATITAPNQSSYPETNHYFNVQLTAEDDAGNETTIDSTDPTLGENLKLYVKETTAPTITIISPSTGATTTTTPVQIEFTVTDTGSGVDESSVVIHVNGHTSSNFAIHDAIENGYRFVYRAISFVQEGENSVYVVASDYDGNEATSSTSTFTHDNTPPSLNVTAPTEGLVTNSTSLTVTGTTNDVTSSPVTVTITVNSVDQGTVTVEEDGTFSKEVTLTSGANAIIVTATDMAGLTSSVTRNVTVDTGAPVFNSVTITPNPVDAGQTYIISVDVTDA